MRRSRPLTVVSAAFIAVLSIVLSACDSGGGDGDAAPLPPPSGEPRGFYMGFTPWPYDSTLDALNTTYSLIQDNGDLVAHHITQGVPWQEALTGAPYPNHLLTEINGRLDQTRNDKVVYLAIDPLSILRDTLVGNWGENGQEARTGAWSSRTFSDPEVIAAFTNFALNLIDQFNPAYFNYGTEANELLIRSPAQFDDFVVFAQGVYNNIKAQHPDLPLMISVAMKSPGSAEPSAFAAQFSRLAPYVDIVGISAYPYAFYAPSDGATPSALPGNWLSQINAIAPNKPVAITETGWVAQDLDIPRFGISVDSSEALQRDYVARLMTEADNLGAAFVVWFSAVDYDAFWNGLLGRDELSAIWRDTGLYDPNTQARTALGTWQENYRRSYQP